MAHPHKGKVQSSNSAKMRGIVGKGGAGTPFGGMSSFKRANSDGEQESFNGHSKGFENGYAHGGKVRARGDRKARGGSCTHGATFTKGGDAKGKVMKETMPGHFAKGGKVKKMANGGRAKHKGDVNIMIMGGKPPMAGPPGMGAAMPRPGGPPPGAPGVGAGPPPPGGPPGAGGAPPMGAPPGGPPMSTAPNPQAQAALQAMAGGAGAGPMSGGLGGGKLPGMKRGGRAYQQGGVTMQQGTDNLPLPAPPQVPPSRSNQGKVPMGGIPVRTESNRGGRFAKGGHVSEGEMPRHEKHWADYSDDNRKSKHGNTGESEELSLATPNRPDEITKADKRARGGKIGKYPDAGAMSGVGRLEQSKRHKV